jgi:protein-tyrosine phosphatase
MNDKIRKLLLNIQCSFFLLLLSAILTLVFALSDEPHLVLDAKNNDALPKRFRTSDENFARYKPMNLQGFPSLHMAGSAQFSAQEFQAALKKLRPPIVLFDLRQESHGYLNGNAISWYGQHDWANRGKTDEECAADEQQRLAAFKQEKMVSVAIVDKDNDDLAQDTQQYSYPVQTVQSEEELAKQYNIEYHRLYVTDHLPPTRVVVDQFVSIAKQLPANVTLYFHCRGGVGRTTTFMLMYDIMRNAKQVSLNDIIERDEAISGANLFKSKDDGPNDGTDYQAQRARFIQLFYRYCKANKNNFQTPF